MSLPAAAWYPDPELSSRIRWWNGSEWTEHVRDHPDPPAPLTVGTVPEPATLPTDAFARTTAEPEMAPIEPQRRFSPVGALELETAAATPVDDAPWFGAAHQSPNEEPSSPPLPPGSAQDSTKPHTIGRKVRLALMTIAVVVLAAGVGVLAMGRLGPITGGSSRETSQGFTPVAGDGYSYEVPDTWSNVHASGSNFDAAFASPTAVNLVIATEAVPANVNVDEPAARDALTAKLSSELQASRPGAHIVSRAPIEVDGTASELVTSEGVDATHVAYGENTFVVVHGGMLLAVDLVGPPGALDDPALQQQFQQIISSIRFD